MVLKIKTSNMSEKKNLFEAGILQNTRKGCGSHQKKSPSWLQNPAQSKNPVEL